MKNVQKIDLGLTGYDELFANDEERKVNKLPRIFDIPISEIDDFPDHPFKVKIDEDMDQLVQSIKERGIITPVTLRPKEDGRYEIVSGHRRKKACEIAGLDTVKAEVREMSRDEAIILMVESNLQRSTILPSEKAFSYKMRLEAMKRQAGRPAQDNYSPVGNNSFGTKSSEIMADEVGESRNTIFRYIRLTELIPPLLDLVDEGRIAFRPAVELSYLKKEEQEDLLEEISYADATPSLAQAIKMKRFSQEGKLSNEVIESIMSEEKPNQKEKIRIKYEDARRFMRPVWWKCKFGHSWKDKVSNRTIEHKNCKTCEMEFRRVLSQLLILRYCGERGLQVKLNDEEITGIPLDAYVPEARLAFVANEREAKYFQETLMVVRHQCEKKKVQLAEINLNSAQDIRIAIVQAFARAHIYISSDEKDVSIVRKRFFAWRSR